MLTVQSHVGLWTKVFTYILKSDGICHHILEAFLTVYSVKTWVHYVDQKEIPKPDTFGKR